MLASLLAPLLMLLCAPAAYADGGSTAPGALSWIKVKDSNGASIWQYEMSLDRGGVTNPGKVIWAFVTDLMWQLYRGYVAIAIWLIDWVLSFSWLSLVAKPLMSIGNNLTTVVAHFGLVPVLLTITAVAAATWMARGRWALGIFELFMSLFIASLAVGVLANPIGLVAGNDGMLVKSRDFGLAVSSGLANDGDTSGSSEQIRQNVTGMLTDTFVRQPAELINFGKVFDGGKCGNVYTKVVKKGPYGSADDIRNTVGDCDSQAGDVASNPNSGMAMSAMVLGPAAFIVLLFAIILAGSVLLTSIYALYQALKLIVTLVTGLLPGSARGSLWMTLADLVMSLITLVFSTVFLGAYLLLIQGVFASSKGGGSGHMETFFIVDILLLVGIAVYWKGRKRIKDAAERLAQMLASRPGAGASSLPQRGRLNPTEMYYRGKVAASGIRVGAQGAAVLGRGAGAVAGATGRGAATAGRAAADPFGRAMSRIQFAATVGDSAGQSREGRSPASRVTDRVQALEGGKRSVKGQLVRMGAVVVGAAATGGTSAAVTAGRTQIASTARRAALSGRLHPALPAGKSSNGGSNPDGPPSHSRAAGPPPPTTNGVTTRLAVGSGRPPARAHVVPGTVVAPTPPPASPSAADSNNRRLRARLEARRARPIALPAAPSRPTPALPPSKI